MLGRMVTQVIDLIPVLESCHFLGRSALVEHLSPQYPLNVQRGMLQKACIAFHALPYSYKVQAREET